MFWEDIFAPAACFIAFFLGLINNGIIAFMFLRDRKLRNVPNTYILSLAFANLLFIVTCLPVAWTDYKHYWLGGTFLCKLTSTTCIIHTGVSAFTLIALSMERYFAAVKPIGIFQMRTQVVWTIIIIWMAACVVAVPSAIFNYVRYGDRNTSYCIAEPDAPYGKIYKTVLTSVHALLFYILPLVIIAIFFILMVTKRPAMQRTTQPLDRVVLVCAIVFIVSLTPNYICWLIYFTKEELFVEYYDTFWDPLFKFGYCLRLFNPCAMPIILYCMGRCSFRYLYCRPPSLAERATDTEMVCTPTDPSCEVLVP